jgi:Zn-dependent protease with chaperone function
MDFFERQDHARRNTRLLIAYFITGVTLLVLSVYLVMLLFFALYQPEMRSQSGELDLARMSFWQPKIFIGAILGTLVVIGSGSWFKARELARGGSAVASMLGGELVNPHTTDPDQRRLLNVVEEMAIASGVPVPQVYLLSNEPGINAFAAGYGVADAAIGVTDGCMRLLSRDELQGVIAHEFSHMLNGDMRLNLRLMSIVFGILVLTIVGRILLRTRGRKNPLPLLGLALLLIGWTGVVFGRLIQAAVSRQREFLADAAAVQFTRNPDGLAGALKKIGGLPIGSKLKSPHATEASHMFFGNGVKKTFLNLWATHPRLEIRIRALEPGFDGRFSRVTPGETPLPAAAPPRAAMARLAPASVSVRNILPGVGAPDRRHLRYAAELRNSFPASVTAAARAPFGATTILYAILLSDDLDIRGRQLDELATTVSIAACEETLRLLPDVRAVALRAKLPLVELVLPALRQLSLPQFEAFRSAITKLVEGDRQIDLFEFMLQKVILRHLQSRFAPAPIPIVEHYALEPLADDCAVLLSALAHVGHDVAEDVARAFQQGANTFSPVTQTKLALRSATGWDLAQVDAALTRLALLSPRLKKCLLSACAETVAADGVIWEAEAELLRAIADSLDCPLPPIIPLN